jgi:hypothetical protein
MFGITLSTYRFANETADSLRYAWVGVMDKPRRYACDFGDRGNGEFFVTGNEAIDSSTKGIDGLKRERSDKPGSIVFLGSVPVSI